MFEKMFLDSMTVYRENKLVYDSVPCRVSPLKRLFSATGEVPDRHAALPRAGKRFKVFHSADAIVEAGDRVRLMKNGQVFFCVAGDSLLYKTHAETPATEEKWCGV